MERRLIILLRSSFLSQSPQKKNICDQLNCWIRYIHRHSIKVVDSLEDTSVHCQSEGTHIRQGISQI